jgi:hypothetical protein
MALSGLECTGSGLPPLSDLKGKRALDVAAAMSHCIGRYAYRRADSVIGIDPNWLRSSASSL